MVSPAHKDFQTWNMIKIFQKFEEKIRFYQRFGLTRVNNNLKNIQLSVENVQQLIINP